MPSIGCLEQWKPNAWRYHFVLVKSEVECAEEGEAVSLATEDLNQAFDGEAPAAERLKALGYRRVEGFKIVNQAATLPKSSDEEREDWTRLSLESLARAYSDDEPEFIESNKGGESGI